MSALFVAISMLSQKGSDLAAAENYMNQVLSSIRRLAK